MLHLRRRSRPEPADLIFILSSSRLSFVLNGPVEASFEFARLVAPVLSAFGFYKRMRSMWPLLCI